MDFDWLISPCFRIYLDMLNVYKVMSENITAAITHNGEQVRSMLFGICSIINVQVTKQPLIKSMRVVKKETLKLIANWVERSNDPQVNFYAVLRSQKIVDFAIFILVFPDGA